MRRCPYCAEDIEDDVTRCPHCGSDLTTAAAQAATAPGQQPAPTAPGTAPAPTIASPFPARETAAAWGTPPAGTWGTPQAQPAPAPSSVQFSHTGHRYLLGYDASDFGIWDRTAPGGPVERFPRSDDGWSQAWQRYASLEPNNQPVHDAGAAPYGAPAPTGAWGQPQTAYHAPQARATNGMAVASLVLGLVGLITFWLLAIPPILALVFGLVGRSQIKMSGGRQEGDGLAIAGIVTGIVGMVIFVIVLIVNINTNSRF